MYVKGTIKEWTNVRSALSLTPSIMTPTVNNKDGYDKSIFSVMDELATPALLPSEKGGIYFYSPHNNHHPREVSARSFGIFGSGHWLCHTRMAVIHALVLKMHRASGGVKDDAPERVGFSFRLIAYDEVTPVYGKKFNGEMMKVRTKIDVMSGLQNWGHMYLEESETVATQ